MPKTQKMVLDATCLILSIIRYESRVKWNNPGKEYRPPLHFGVVANEKGAFGSTSTKVANSNFFTLYMYIKYMICKLHFLDNILKQTKAHNFSHS